MVVFVAAREVEVPLVQAPSSDVSWVAIRAPSILAYHAFTLATVISPGSGLVYDGYVETRSVQLVERNTQLVQNILNVGRCSC
jgi:hypothetical protein